MSRRRGSSSERHAVSGFTVVEVVVALTILSLILLATISAMRTFGNTQTTLDKMTYRIDELRSVSGFLRETLQAAAVGSAEGTGTIGGIALGPSFNSAVEKTYFKGDPSSLVWKAPVFFGESAGGTMLIQVARIEDTLVLKWQNPPRMNTAVEWGEASERELLAGVEEFTVAYRPNFFDEWQSEWKQKGSPVLVRLVLKVNGRFWPELIMQVPQ